MPQSQRSVDLSRRRALAFGGGLLATGPAAVKAFALGAGGEGAMDRGSRERATHPPAPPAEIFEQVLHTRGRVSENVLAIQIPRGDLHEVRGPHGLTFTAAWEVHHDWSVQTLPSGEAMLNGEMSLLQSETDPVIDQLLAHGLVFQAFHQHFTGQTPQIWHIHMRGRGEARALATALAAVIRVTGTPFPPPSSPSHPSTPLQPQVLARILGGSAQVSEGGVVSVSVPRKNPMRLGGVAISPNLAIATHVRFKPLQGTRVAAAPDFGMTAAEVAPVMQVMRRAGWDVDCLYNQETYEEPQLYWSHQLKIGEATELAREIRAGLDRMDLKFKS
jgi:hypothetical protein